jgi:ADP-heptose:LPS heptosyltransferase
MLHSITKKIAIFRALQLGDMLCSIPAIRALRKKFPHAHISLIGLPWQKSFASRFSNYFDNFISFPGWPGLPEQPFDPTEAVGFIKKMQAENFDVVLQMQGNGILTNSMCILWNARRTVGLRKNGEYAFNENDFPISEDSDHEILRFLKLTDVLGVPRDGTHLELPITPAEEARALQIAETLCIVPNRYICVHPGSRDPKRRWNADHFAYVINALGRENHRIVLTGSIHEKTILDTIQSKVDHPISNLVIDVGDVPLGELAALIKNAKLLISNDTGVSHVASALQVPSIIIFSPFSDLERWRPLNHQLHRAIAHDFASKENVLSATMEKLNFSDSTIFLNQK